jgi:RNA polymerase sigma-70 factor (ECF subfamily)
MGQTATDEALLAAARDGDEAAFGEFYRRHVPSITAFHRRGVGNPEAALDLVAETFAAVVTSLDRFDPRLGSGLGWLFGIAANKQRESLRRGRVESAARRRLGLEPLVFDDAALARVEEIAEAGASGLLEALERLPDDQRAAVQARVVDERPYAEIAAELRCSEAVVRQRVRRGLLRLRRLWEEPA